MKEKFRLVIEYPDYSYNDGMDKTVDQTIDRRRLKETGSGMDLLRGIRDRCYVGSAENVMTAIECLIDEPGISAFKIYRHENNKR